VKLKKALLFVIVVIILFSFIVTFINQTKIPNFQGFNSVFPVNQLVIHSPIDFGAPTSANIPALNQTTRMTIFSFVEENPGVHFRAICSGLGISIGVAQYHLGILTKTGLISFFQDGRYKRYFRSKSFGAKEMQAISVLRHKTAGKILRLLSENHSLAHHDLATKLEISSQALSWQMRGLREMNLVNSVTESLEVTYSINEEYRMIIQGYLGVISARKF
jgi:DNA-binding transcriptional ArsR family regulator